MLTQFNNSIFIHHALSAQESREAFLRIMSGKCTAVQIAALLTALHQDGENAEEITGAAQAMRALGSHVDAGSSDVMVDIVGTGGDALSTINISTIACFVAAGAGCVVAKHGNRAVTGKCGAADLLSALGVNLDASEETAAACIRTHGIGFLFAQRLHPAMRYAAPVRRELKFRTIFNLLGPLTNPAGVRNHLIGVFAPQYTQIFAEVLKQLGSHRAMIVCGEDGMDELSVCAPSQVSQLDADGTISSFTVRPEEYFGTRYEIAALRGGDASENATIARKILAGQGTVAQQSAVLLNAAAALVVGGVASTLADGLTRAEESLRSGAAQHKLDELVEAYR